MLHSSKKHFKNAFLPEAIHRSQPGVGNGMPNFIAKQPAICGRSKAPKTTQPQQQRARSHQFEATHIHRSLAAITFILRVNSPLQLLARDLPSPAGIGREHVTDPAPVCERQCRAYADAALLSVNPNPVLRSPLAAVSSICMFTSP